MASVGYFTHLLLDELWSVDFDGVSLRGKRSQGTALALFKRNIILTLFAYLLAYWAGKEVYMDYQNLPKRPNTNVQDQG